MWPDDRPLCSGATQGLSLFVGQRFPGPLKGAEAVAAQPPVAERDLYAPDAGNDEIQVVAGKPAV